MNNNNYNKNHSNIKELSSVVVKVFLLLKEPCFEFHIRVIQQNEVWAR